MNISYKTKKLEKLCNSNKELTKKFGAVAEKAMGKLAFLDAAECLEDVSHLPPYSRHELQGGRKGQFSIDLAGRNNANRIVFVPNHDPVPRKKDGGYDLRSITMIKIIEMGDYHNG